VGEDKVGKRGRGWGGGGGGGGGEKQEGKEVRRGK